MNYQESIDYLHRCAALGSRPGLDTITTLLNRLQNPQNRLQIIHLAGTNGKGSVGCFLQSALMAAGYRVGFFTSPYFVCHREMIRLNGENISESATASILTKVGEKADAMEKEGMAHPTEFEIMTAAAYSYFDEEKCDFAIIESGMGGAKDATNVMQASAVSVLTRIDYDHLQFLGTTLAEITREKCGIFRSGCPVVVYPEQESEVFSVIEQELKKTGAPLVLPLKDSVLIEKTDETGSIFSYGKWKQVQISLRGKHQVFNAVTALSVLSVLMQNSVLIPPAAIYSGFASARWEGRFEVLSDKPVVVLDGAHNLNGAHAFSATVSDCYPDKTFIGVVGMLKDKDFEASLAVFSTVCRKLILTEVPNPRSATAKQLLKAAERLGIDAVCEKNPESAVCRAFSEQQKEEGIFCVGSLYALPAFKEACLRFLK